MIISFAGHSFVHSNANLKEIVKEQIKRIALNSQSAICYLGGYGDFDAICAYACRELKQEYLGIEIVYVTPYITEAAQSKIKEMQNYGLCDRSIYPPLENVPPKFAILKRNEWIIKNSDVIIAYVNHDWGGAYKSLQMAKRQKKKIINIGDLPD